jgi:hypothetical protein
MVSSGSSVTSTLFLAFVMLMAAAIVGVTFRYCRRRTALGVSAGLALSLLYVGVVGYSGTSKSTSSRLPAAALILGPVAVFLIALVVRSVLNRKTPSALPLWILIGAQCFRVGVELFLHRLYSEGVVPRMLTYDGANVDILIGASAPIVSWISTRGGKALWLVLGWNIAGLVILMNVVARAILAAPGPLHLIQAEVPNLLFTTFPYMFIPGFFVPLAVTLHVLSIRKITRLRRRAM